MRYSSFQIWLTRVASIVAIAAGLVLSVAALPIQASEPESTGVVVAKPTALAATGGFDYLLAAHPVVGKVGQPRTVFLHHPRPNCPRYGVSLDTSAMEASNLVVLRRISGAVICPSVGHPPELARFEFVVTPTKVGLLTIRDEIRGVEITIQSLPTGLASIGGLDYLLAAHPVVGKVGQPRTVFLNQSLPFCPVYKFSLDISLMESQNLVLIRRNTANPVCPTVGAIFVRTELEFTPTKVGLLTIRDGNSGAEITIQTLPTALPSKFDTNGMWFDAATNGSGIALHHRRGTTDQTFGTWFLYSNDGTSRWYSLQSTSWQQDGSVLEGLLFQTRGGCAFANLAGCPALGSFRTEPPQDLYWETPPLARITFQSPTRARAEVLTLGGTVLFTSELTKLQY